MASTNKTKKLGLSQFEAGDKPAWLTDHNQDMLNIEEGTLDKATYNPSGTEGDLFLASNQKLTGYAKQSQYTPIVSGDNPLAALGKLEAGVIDAGDMKKSLYDADGDGKVDKAKLADSASSVAWGSVTGKPSALPTPNKLTLQANGVEKVAFDGSAAGTFNVTPAEMGAAGLEGGKVPASQLPIDDTIVSIDAQKVASANSVRAAKEKAIADSGTAADTKLKDGVSNILYTNSLDGTVATVKDGVDVLFNRSTLAGTAIDEMGTEIAGIGSDVGVLQEWSKTAWTSENFPIIQGILEPTLRGSSVAGSATYDLQRGIWLIRERSVLVWIALQIKDMGGAKGYMSIAGLKQIPIAVNGVLSVGSINRYSNILLSTNYYSLGFYPSADGSIALVQSGNNVPEAPLTEANIKVGSRLFLQTEYFF